jgi:hypothetical protein
MPARSLQEHLLTAEGTARFAAHAQRLLRFQGLLEASLPATLRGHARVANLRQGKLVIHAANSAVAAKLRQLGPRFAEVFLNDGAKLTQIEVKVQARAPAPPKAKRQPIAKPGTKQEQALANLAHGLPEGSAMRDPLLRLLQAIKER